MLSPMLNKNVLKIRDSADVLLYIDLNSMTCDGDK